MSRIKLENRLAYQRSSPCQPNPHSTLKAMKSSTNPKDLYPTSKKYIILPEHILPKLKSSFHKKVFTLKNIPKLTRDCCILYKKNNTPKANLPTILKAVAQYR